MNESWGCPDPKNHTAIMCGKPILRGIQATRPLPWTRCSPPEALSQTSGLCSPADSAWLVHTPLLGSLGSRELLLKPSSAFVPITQLSTASHLPYILLSHSYPALTDKSQGADLATELAFLSHSHMLTILPFSSTAGLPPAPASALGRQPLCVRHSTHQGHCPWPHHGCRWVATEAFIA